MQRLTFFAVATTLILATASLASAQPPKIFLNDVDITGVTGQSFESATVRIDPTGNIYIDAPQYKVEVQGAAATPPPNPGALSSKYFLVASNSRPGAAGYDIDVYVNGTLFKTFKNAEPQLVADISDKLALGNNAVTFQARKVAGAIKSSAPQDAITLFVGSGSAVGNQLTIERQFFTFSVNASQVANESKNFTLDVK